MIRSIPEPGDIGLTNVVGLAGWGIRAAEWLNGDGFTDFEHAFVLLPEGQLIEAQPGGAVIRPVSDYADRHVLYVSPADLTAGQRVLICAAAERYVGVGYSAAEYFALAAHRFHVPVPGLRGYIASSRRMICSQLVDQAYQDAAVHLFADGRWPGYVTPGSLFDLLGQEAQR